MSTTGQQANKPANRATSSPSKGSIKAASRRRRSGCSTAFRAAGRNAEFLTFPEYTTAIGDEIGRALQGERDYQPDTLQLLYIANRFEFRPRITTWLRCGHDGDLRSLPGVEHRVRRSAGRRCGMAERDPDDSCRSRR